MKQYDFFGFRAEVDEVATKNWYAAYSGWGCVRCCHEVYPYGAPNFPKPHFDLEFWITLPWVLSDENRE